MHLPSYLYVAREGHCKIPNDYPDLPLRQWLAKQQDMIHLYSTNQPIELKPVQIKILYALGVHGSERTVAPVSINSRVLKRKVPARKRVKRQRVANKSNTKSE